MSYQYQSFIPTHGISLGIVERRTYNQRLTIRKIQDAVAAFYHIAPEEMTSHNRERHIARPRQVAMYLARTMFSHTTNDGRKLPLKSLPDIGARFGNRDHTTVIHAIRVVQGRIKVDKDFAADLELIQEGLTR